MVQFPALHVSEPSGDRVPPELAASSQLYLVVEFTTQLDLAEFGKREPIRRLPKLQRRRAVVRALERVAARDAERFRPWVEELRQQDLVLDYRRLSIVSGLVLTVRPAAISALANHPGVASLWLRAAQPAPAWLGSTQASQSPERESWALSALGVFEAWGAGLDGQGVVVGIIDSGASADHEQLSPNFLGGERGWWDPRGVHSRPTETVLGHGTGVLSQAVGSNRGGVRLGVAPAARWTACLGFPDGHYDPVLLAQCADWMLTVAQPDVLVGAWQLPGAGCDPSLQRLVAAWRSAEILPVFAAGNHGPEASSDHSPANYQNLAPEGGSVVSVGGLARDLSVYVPSSRGPNSCGGSTFPSLSAPAEDLPAALPLGDHHYVQARGTSFAAGLVAGAAALLIQRSPEASVGTLEEALRRGTLDLGVVGPDNDFGQGRLHLPAALAALEKLLQ